MSETPKKGDKGGECNRTACKNPDAECYNRVTHKWYCIPCGRKINDSSLPSGGDQICSWTTEIEYEKSQIAV